MIKYHIHGDLVEVPGGLEDFLRSQRLYPDDFVQCSWPVSYEPHRHWTRKFEEGEGEAFKHVMTEVKQWAAEHPNLFLGYMEAEVITTDMEIPFRPYDSSLKIPFKLKTTRLGLGFFRESEIHISLSENESEMAVRQALHDAGFYPARYMEEWGPEEIWTIQGSRSAIKAILPTTIAFLRTVGGVARCTLQEETVAGCLVQPMDMQLPPVVSKIEWL